MFPDKNSSQNDVISENAIKNTSKEDKWIAHRAEKSMIPQKTIPPVQVSRRLQPLGGAQISLPSVITPPAKRLIADIGLVKSKNTV